jgi:hypothetical protein
MSQGTYRSVVTSESPPSRPCGSPAGQNHVGVVFIHGIGSQQAGSSLREWSAPIVRIARDIRRHAGLSSDPVVGMQADGTGRVSLIELEVPHTPRLSSPGEPQGQPSSFTDHWVLTEAFWADAVSPPSFGQMSEWLGPQGVIRQLIWRMTRRTRYVTPAEPNGSEPHIGPEKTFDPTSVDSVRTSGSSRGIGHRVSNLIGDVATRGGGVAVALSVQALSSLLLLLYAVLRSIETVLPIGPLGDGALTRPIDRFILNWFGDLYVLLIDPVQRASVCDRVLQSLDLSRFGPIGVVAVAHSGGAVVSYLTLANGVSKHQLAQSPMKKLVTFGEGLNLAVDLLAAQMPRSQAVREFGLDRTLLPNHPALEWVDFWASSDPAPHGPLDLPSNVVSVRAANASGANATSVPLDSRCVLNRASVTEDHGAYWTNDEEFVVPLLSLIAATGSPASEFHWAAAYNDEALVAGAVRKRRVAVLATWRRLTSQVAFIAILIWLALAPEPAQRFGDGIIELLRSVPGADVLASSIQKLHDVVLPTSTESASVRNLADLGSLVLSIAFVVGVVATLWRRPALSDMFHSTGRVGGWAHRLRADWWTVVICGWLLVLAGRRMFQGWAMAPETFLLVCIGFFLSVLVVTTGVHFGRNSERRWGALITARVRKVPTNWRLGTTTLTMLVLVLLAIVGSGLALLVRPDIARTAFALIGAVFVFGIVRQVGAWRWRAWDRRARASWIQALVKGDNARVEGVSGVVKLESAALILLLAATAIVLVDPDLLMGWNLPLALAIWVVLMGVVIDALATQPAPSPADDEDDGSHPSQFAAMDDGVVETNTQ